MAKIGMYLRTAKHREISRLVNLGNKNRVGTHHSEEAKRKISLAHLGKKMSSYRKKTLSEEHKRKIGLSNLGKSCSEENKRKIGLRYKGKHLSEKTRYKLSIAHMGKPSWNKGKLFSEETRMKQSVSAKLRLLKTPNTFLGKHHSEESKKKNSLSHKLFLDNMTEEQRKAYLKKIFLASCKRVSKPQKELYFLLKQVFSDATLEYPIKTLRTYRFADIGVPSLKIAFEYDGIHWHEKKKEEDEKRDLELAAVGWATFRINKESLKILSKQCIFNLEGI